MLLLPPGSPLARAACDVASRAAEAGAPIVVRDDFVWRASARIAIGAVGMSDSLDDRADPSLDAPALIDSLVAAGVAVASAIVLARAIADREGALSLEPLGPRVMTPEGPRPPTLFEAAALHDVLGSELAELLPLARVQIESAPAGHPHNDCRLVDGVAIVRLLSTNGRSLAGRTHALVHELGHALIAVCQHTGRPYGASYGSPDYGRFLDAQSQSQIVDEEAIVRAIADAWLLRRNAVTWARTWPGAIDDAGRALDADDLAAWSRARLAQGLGLPFTPVHVRRHPRS